jgi:hypothetical protein
MNGGAPDGLITSTPILANSATLASYAGIAAWNSSSAPRCTSSASGMSRMPCGRIPQQVLEAAGALRWPHNADGAA